jgi:ATP-dependent DNA ligase
MLALLESCLPVGDQWRYEPKLDGFRGLLWRSSDTVRLLSRNMRDLAPWFPELVRAANALPAETLLDGKIVIVGEQRSPDFGALQRRLCLAPRFTAQAAAERPAGLVAFDLLELAGCELVEKSLTERRRQLEGLLDGLHPCLQLVLQTADVELARDWLTLLQSVEGVVAKRADGRYASGRRRDWIKVKRYQTADCVVIGIAGDGDTPRLVLALRYEDGTLHHAGLTRVIPAEALAPLAGILDQAGPLEHAIPTRWRHDAIPPWRRVPPELVCEIRIGPVDLLVALEGVFGTSSEYVCQ